MRYCSVEDVRKYDVRKLVEHVSDEIVDENIQMSTDIINYKTKRVFPDINIPSAVIKACALITIKLLLDEGTIQSTKDIIMEKIDGVGQIQYSSDVVRDLPPTIDLLLAPYILAEKTSYVNGIIGGNKCSTKRSWRIT